MDNCKSPTSETKSLMNTLEKLQSHKERLVDLSNFSNGIIDKIKNPLQVPNKFTPEPCEPELKKNDVPDIIDLFDELIVQLHNETDKLAKNLGKINSFID